MDCGPFAPCHIRAHGGVGSLMHARLRLSGGAITVDFGERFLHLHDRLPKGDGVAPQISPHADVQKRAPQCESIRTTSQDVVRCF